MIRKGGLREAILHSVGANATHGIRRTNADKRRAVLMLLEDPEWSTWSDNAIAKACSVSQPLVTRIRADHLQLVEDAPRTVERSGKVYQMDTARIGRRAEPVLDASSADEPEREPASPDQPPAAPEAPAGGNLSLRAELSPAQRASATVRRKEVYEQLHPETKAETFHGNRHTGSRRTKCDGQPAPRFTAETAAASGRSERAVQLDVERGKKIDAGALSMISGTALDTTTYLDTLIVERPAWRSRLQLQLGRPLRSGAGSPIADRACHDRGLPR